MSYLMFWPTLRRSRVFEPRLQPLEHELERELLGRAGVAVADRDVGRARALDRERNADELRAERIDARRLGVERGELRAFEPQQPRVELLFGEHRLVIARFGRARGDRGRRRHALDRLYRRCVALPSSSSRRHVLNSKRSKSCGELRLVLRLDLERFGFHRQRHVALDREQLARLRQPVDDFLRRFSPTTPPISPARRRTSSSEPYCASHLHAVFGPDLVDAGNVVDRVADQREVIEEALGLHAELLLDAGFVERLVRHRVDERHRGLDELRHVLVAGRDDDAHAGALGLLGERADHVVGLDAVDDEQRPAHRVDRLVQRLDLEREVVRHRFAGRLVLRDRRRRGRSCLLRRKPRRYNPRARPCAACAAC